MCTRPWALTSIHPPNQEKIKMMVSKGAWALGRVRAMELEAEVSKRRQVKIENQIKSNQASA
jgi:hypothetical protein